MRVDLVAAALLLGVGCGNQPGATPEVTNTQPVQPTATPVAVADAGTQYESRDAAAAAPTPASAHTAPSATRSIPTAKSEMRCTLRVSAKGLYVDGEPKTEEEAIAICKRRAGAMVVLEEGVPPGDWKRVEAALRAVKITILMRGPVGDVECSENPLAKGCQ